MVTNPRDAYSILQPGGAYENCSAKTLKAAYHKLAMRYQANGTEPDDDKLRQVIEAYEALTGKPAEPEPEPKPPTEPAPAEPPAIKVLTVEEMIKDNRKAAQADEVKLVAALRTDNPKVIDLAVAKFVDSLLTIKELPEPSVPFDVARVFYNSRLVHRQGHKVLRFWRGDFYAWALTHWERMARDEWANELYRVSRTAHIPEVSKSGELLPEEWWREWQPTKSNIGEMYRAMQALCTIPQTTEPPVWLTGRYRKREDNLTIPFANGLLLVTLNPLRTKLIGLHPEHFNTFVLPFEYNGDALEPKRWLWFLNDEWGDDPESIKLLQEWFGYVVTGRTDLHKIMLLTGPPRAGKGVTAAVLQALMGDDNCTGITLESFGNQFGMASLVGKTLAVIGDARVTGDSSKAVERLLSLSGQDKVQIQIKYHADWVGRMPTRVMITSNETPALLDASGAIVSRMLMLTMRHSHIGREDTSILPDILATELPGVLNWALEGAERLYRQGHFTVPPADTELRAEMRAMASPVEAFMDERCELILTEFASTAALYTAWQVWCGLNGEKPGTAAKFAHNLRVAAKGQIKPERPHVAGKRLPGYRGIKLGKVASDEEAI